MARSEGGFPRRTILRRALQALVAAPILAAIFLLALMAAGTAPSAPIVRHLAEDQEMFSAPRLRVLSGRKIDVGTECIGLSFGLPPAAAEQGLFEKAVRAPVFVSCPALTDYAATGVADAAAIDDYHRYWHGYAALSRPLLALMPYRDLRMLTFNLVLALFLALGYRLAKDFSLKFAFAVLLPFYIVNFAGFFILWTKAVSWIVMLGGGLYFAAARRPYERDPLFAFFLLGALTAYFDLLTTPPMIFGVPAYIYFFYLMRGGAAPGPRALLLRLAAIAGFWLAGYAGLWTAKFALSAAVIGPAAIGDVMAAAANRIGGDWESVKHFPGAATLENFEAFKPLWGGAALLLFFILPFARQRRRRTALLLARRAPAFAVLAFAPFVWFEVLSNHSQIHGLFTHAILVLTFIPLSLILFGEAGRLCDSEQVKRNKEKTP